MSHHWTTGLVVMTTVLFLEAPDPPPKKPTAREKVKAKTKAVELPALNKKIVEFAEKQLGKKVGNGQCNRLADEAMRYAGAVHEEHRGVDGDYVWGEPVKSWKETLPGDVLQFRDVVFEGRIVKSNSVTTWHVDYSHHTAVVAEVKDGGKTIVVLHQNVGPTGASDEKKQIVQRDTLRTTAMTRGTIWIYRPVDH